jgi:predicted O-linked N-acetylglucosamine transferase (SPINDLY family)
MTTAAADAAGLLGDALAAIGAGRFEAAREKLERVLRLVPEHPDAVGLLAVADLNAGRVQDAEQRALRALTLAPGNVQHAYTLGQALAAQGRHGEAASAYRRALAGSPQTSAIHYALGLTLAAAGHLDAAATAFDRAAHLDPAFAAAEFQLGQSLQQLGRLEEAASAYERGLAREPTSLGPLINLGAVLGLLGRHGEAEEVARRAIRLDPRRPEPYANLGKSLCEAGFNNDAIDAFERAIALGLRDAGVLNDLGGALYNAGLAAQAVARYREAADLDPDFHPVRSNMLLAMNYEATDAAALHRAHREADRHPAPRSAARLARRGERLRIGYVSPDFRAHSVSFFAEPLLARHDRRRVEVVCYAVNARQDGVTARLRLLADLWVDAAGLSHEALAERVRADRVDVLVDLAGHTGGNRLPAFALRPAPVQMSWLGYPTVTGLRAIDYRLTDAVVDPPEEDGTALDAERPLRLPASYFCYRPLADAPAVGPLPARSGEGPTFGSFNNLMKVSPRTLDLWAAVLHAVPRSRLVIKNRALVDPVTRMRIAERFAARDVGPERLVLTGWEADSARHLDWYNRVDIALDTFPYNGATTTCEALWMGVPVASLAGGTHASRMGASILGAAGLADWVARSEAELVALCVRRAGELDALAALRAGLREQLRATPLLDEPAFARAFEALIEGAAR